jgi:hypothetical protein
LYANPFIGTCWSSSTHDEQVALQQYFSYPRLIIYFFPTSPIKLKPAKGGKVNNSKPHGSVKSSSHSTTHVRLVVPFASLRHPVKNAGSNSEPKTFLHPNITIQCNCEVALKCNASCRSQESYELILNLKLSELRSNNISSFTF